MCEVQQCDALGLGIEYVLIEIYKGYFNGSISEKAMRSIIWNTLDGFGDGKCSPNPKVTFGYARTCMCGNCLAIVEKGKPLYSVLDLSSDVLQREGIMQWSNPTLVTDRLCEDCFDKVLENYCGEKVGDRERKYIKRSIAPGKWKSTGEFGKEFFDKSDPVKHRDKWMRDIAKRNSER